MLNINYNGKVPSKVAVAENWKDLTKPNNKIVALMKKAATVSQILKMSTRQQTWVPQKILAEVL